MTEENQNLYWCAKDGEGILRPARALFPVGGAYGKAALEQFEYERKGSKKRQYSDITLVKVELVEVQE